MSSRYPFDPFALPDRPDVLLSPDPGPGQFIENQNVIRRISGAMTVLAVWIGATAGLSILIFLPVLASEISQIETLGVAGRAYTAQAFVARLADMFLGSSVIAAALVCFLASAVLAARGQPTFRTPEDADRETDPLHRTTGLHPLTLDETINVRSI
ncbi:hypothetical protein [Roseibium sp.]|uniref:hypothetical protein n=1 Tax=Roseibium sp. TaxID=1936156 RepID=UPI003A97ABE4